ncbi:MAG: ATP-binding protein [Colwellia sp.]|nr:ATP-binding protein [Colwellia sp.]
MDISWFMRLKALRGKLTKKITVQVDLGKGVLNLKPYSMKQPLQLAWLMLIGCSDHVVIDVADNGKGIGDKNITQALIPFFTTKKEGSGVGLVLTRQVMLAHNVKVAVRNNNQGGAMLSLTF